MHYACYPTLVTLPPRNTATHSYSAAYLFLSSSSSVFAEWACVKVQQSPSNLKPLQMAFCSHHPVNALYGFIAKASGKYFPNITYDWPTVTLLYSHPFLIFLIWFPRNYVLTSPSLCPFRALTLQRVYPEKPQIIFSPRFLTVSEIFI